MLFLFIVVLTNVCVEAFRVLRTGTINKAAAVDYLVRLYHTAGNEEKFIGIGR